MIRQVESFILAISCGNKSVCGSSAGKPTSPFVHPGNFEMRFTYVFIRKILFFDSGLALITGHPDY